MREYYIWLLSVMGVANPRSGRLISHYGGIKETYDALNFGKSDLSDDGEKRGEFGFLKPSEARALKKSSLDKAGEMVEWCEKKGYGILTADDADYPENLKHIYNPPLLLFTEGDVSGLNGDILINVIGTRTPSEYSNKVAYTLCAGLAGAGVTVVSGMAVGLDKCSMSAALEQNGKVVGVLACGIDVEYPKGSKAFRKSLSEAGGVCVSEMMPRDETRPAYFHNRNRLMSGLSSGTLIVEAAERSGCHITASHAIAQNRDLFCVPPHDILDPRYSGVVRYLRDGAFPVFSYVDIINEYLPYAQRRTSESATPRDLEKSDKVPTEDTDNSYKLSAKQATPQSAPKADYSVLPPEQEKIIAALKENAMTFDEIVKGELCDAGKAYELLLDMELDGLIERVAGDRYVGKS